MTTHVEAGAGDRNSTGPEKKPGRVVLVVGALVVVVAAIVAFTRWLHRRHAITSERDARTNQVAKGPRVQVIAVGMSSAAKEIVLPGDVRGFEQATLYGKISGYLRSISVDRGDRVKKGKVVAILESPESDDDVAAAISDAVAKRVVAQRYAMLAASGVASSIDRENAEAAAEVAEASLARMKTLSGYELVRAPFDGIVTARYVDPGALVPAATSVTQTAQPIVDVATVDRLRVFIYLGQEDATFVKLGDPVDVWQDEKPSEVVAASIARTASALDPRTRTMQTEIDLDNRGRMFLPGVFVRVRLHVKVPPSPVVPNEAIVVREGESYVAIVENGKARMAKVDLGPTDGKSVRVLKGLNGGERVAINVPVLLEDGDAVEEVPVPPPKPTNDAR